MAIVLALAAVLAVVVVVLVRGGGEIVYPVHALWYGQDAEGAVVSGVTTVDITAPKDDPRTLLSLDTSPLEEQGAGVMWQAATALAEAHSVMESGFDPRLGQVTYSIPEQIDGPSAGALLSVGSLAAINDVPLLPGMTMTGTVRPDGSVGPVGGIPAKLRAAAEAGLTRVLIPLGETTSIDPVDGATVELATYGRTLGLDVVPVASVADAYAIMTGTTLPESVGKGPAADRALTELLNRRAAALNAETASVLARLDSREQATSDPDERSRIRDLTSVADDAIGDDDPVLAYASAAEAGKAASVELARSTLLQEAATAALPTLVDRTRQDVLRFREGVLDDLRKAAQTPVTSMEQAPALADALSWGDRALAVANVSLDLLDDVGSVSELEEIVTFLEPARFDEQTHLPTSLEVLGVLQGAPIANPEGVAGLIDAYASLLGDASQANLAYMNSLGIASGSEIAQKLSQEVGSRYQEGPQIFADVPGTMAQSVLRLSAAMGLFADSTSHVNQMAATEPGTIGSVVIGKNGDFSTEADVARETVDREVATASGFVLDPSYLAWSRDWASSKTDGRLPGATDMWALEGLQQQWRSVLQGRVLVALGKSREEGHLKVGNAIEDLPDVEQ